MEIVCPWCRADLTSPPYLHPQIPQHEERGYGRWCPGSFSYPDQIKDVADIRHRNGWDRKLPAHP